MFARLGCQGKVRPDLVTDLLAAFVAFDVPAAFCAPEVFVDAATTACDYWGLMIGAALSVYVDAAVLCSQKMMNGWVFERFLELLEVFLESMAHSGFSISVSSCGLMAWLLGAHLVAEMCGCGFGSSCCNVVLVSGTVFGGCYRMGVCWIAATTRAALVELFDKRILHAAAANVAAILCLDLINFVVTSEAFPIEYLCNMRKQHAAAASAAAILCLDLNNFVVTSEASATEYVCNMLEQLAAAASAAALRGTFNFISIWEDVFESASLVSWFGLSGMVVLCAGFRNLFWWKSLFDFSG